MCWVIVAVSDDELKTDKMQQQQCEQQLSLLDNGHEDDSELPHCSNSSVLSASRKR